MAKTRLAQIADIHLGPLPEGRGKLSLKQFMGYLSWSLKRSKRHDSKVLDILKDDISVQEVSHICVCGDQTNLGTKVEYAQATRWLQNLADAEKISVVPGNHDAYSKDFLHHINRYWLPWMLDRDSKYVGLPFVRQFQDVCIIGVSSAVLTKLFMADGAVEDEHMEELERLLLPLSKEDHYRVLMIHHPPVLSLAPKRKALRGIKRIQHYLERFEIDMVLHGHLHKPLRSELVFGNKRVPVLGTASASSNGKGIPPSQYYLIDVEKIADEWNVQIHSRQYDPKRKVFVEAALPKQTKM